VGGAYLSACPKGVYKWVNSCIDSEYIRGYVNTE